MILIGLGANLPTDLFGPPRATLGAALGMLKEQGITLRQRSPWYQSAPVPASDQPWFVNGVCEIQCGHSAADVVKILLDLENQIGRVRSVQNAARIIDLDLLAYDDEIITANADNDLSVPHPRMYGRAFVMLPLRDIAPDWLDPLTGKGVETFVNELDAGQQAEKMNDASGIYGTEWMGTKYGR